MTACSLISRKCPECKRVFMGSWQEWYCPVCKKWRAGVSRRASNALYKNKAKEDSYGY
jgi:uncharacterized Zn finger protein (UPF0148 family)